MMIVTIYWLLILLTSIALGWPMVRLMSAKGETADTNGAAEPEPVLVLTTGWVILAVLGHSISLFSALNTPVRLLIFLPAGISSWVYRRELWAWGKHGARRLSNWPLIAKVAWGLIILTAMVKTVVPSEYVDEIGYHLPAIRWLEYFPVVPGTANLEDRLGFNAGSNVLHALFSFSDWWPGGLYDLNALFFIVFAGWLIHWVQGLWRGNHKAVFSAALAAGGLVYAFRAFLTSMNPDTLIIFGGIYLLCRVIAAIEQEENRDRAVLVWWAATWLVFLITCKFSTVLLAPVLLFLWWPIRRGQTARLIGRISISAGVILLPWLLRNYYLSGYLIYPVYWLDVFEVDWKVPLEVARGQYHYVSIYAKTFVTEFCRYQHPQVPFTSWFPIWNGFVGKESISRLVMIGVPAAILLATMQLVRPSQVDHRRIRTLLWLTLYLGGIGVLWFFHIPAMRFGWPWLLACVTLGVTVPLRRMIARYPQYYRTALLVLVLLVSLRHAVVSLRESPDFYRYVWTPAPVEPLQDFETITIDGRRFQLSDDMLCRGAVPPCLPDCYDRRLRLRTGRLLDGFYIENK